MNLCDIEVIQSVLKSHGFRFSKSLGQNFLTSEWVPQDTARGSGVDKNSYALEVGPGMGCLTKELSLLAKEVVSIELDRTLFPILDETLADCDNIKFINRSEERRVGKECRL